MSYCGLPLSTDATVTHRHAQRKRAEAASAPGFVKDLVFKYLIAGEEQIESFMPVCNG